MTIKAVLLDADGVIQETDETFLRDIRALVPDQADEFLADLFGAEIPCARGIGDFRDDLSEVLSRWQVAVPVDEVLKYWHRIDMIDGLFDLIQSLRNKGLIVCLATNQQSHRMAYMRDQLGYDAHFDHCFYSCEVGHTKPEADYFHAIANQLPVVISECLFVDDSEANVAGAGSAGMLASHYKFRERRNAASELLALVQARLV